MSQVYDGHNLLNHKAQVEQWFAGCTIVGDQHFDWAAKFFEKCRIVAPVSAHIGELQESPSLRHPKMKKRALSDADTRRNSDIRRIRSRIETAGASCKRIFESLDKKFLEDEGQHDCLVRTALAFHNLRLKSK